jgi:hypothetical protein
MVKILVSTGSSTMSKIELGGHAVEDSTSRCKKWEDPIQMFVVK